MWFLIRSSNFAGSDSFPGESDSSANARLQAQRRVRAHGHRPPWVVAEMHAAIVNRALIDAATKLTTDETIRRLAGLARELVPDIVGGIDVDQF